MLLNLLSQSHIVKPLFCFQILVINNAVMSKHLDAQSLSPPLDYFLWTESQKWVY